MDLNSEHQTVGNPLIQEQSNMEDTSQKQQSNSNLSRENSNSQNQLYINPNFDLRSFRNQNQLTSSRAGPVEYKLLWNKIKLHTVMKLIGLIALIGVIL
mmetsp:Transcript_6576/g.11110  ORF Transcript_6576/g.11110 Transcript_6576/m.11110 type:complete len:99 (-) Transcript_6576:479-775(-)